MTAAAAPRGTFDRDQALQRLRTERFDVLVVGGGITGCGVALDAAARGLSTALVERADFASGTSSKSSKMVHGGLRYLQQHDFRLVYEGLHERQRLLDNAPHLVSPLPFLIPLFGGGGVVQKGVARTYATALWLYDITGGWRIGRRHRRIGRDEALAHLPTLRTDRLAAGFLYYDARADDARLTLAIARTATLDYGAVATNYTDVLGLLHGAGGQVTGARVRAELPVPGAAAAAEFEVQAKVVVNATGVWADDVRALDEATHPHSIRPAKGIHITVGRSKFPADIAAVIPVPKDRRSIFVVPWADGDDVYLGTTDTDWDGPLDDPTVLPEDVAYLIDAANAVTTDPLSTDDVTGIWVGLRPLLDRTTSKHLSARTADLSRRHTVNTSPNGMITVTGGKLTTYRRMAEDTVDAVVAVLGNAAPDNAARCPTRRLAIRGSSGLDAWRRPGVAGRYGLDGDVFTALVGRHGGETGEVLELASGDPELLTPLVPGLPHLKVEALWAVREEMAMTVEDVLSRRTRSLLRRAESAAASARSTGALLAARWDRPAVDVEHEADAFAHDARAALARAGLPSGLVAEPAERGERADHGEPVS